MTEMAISATGKFILIIFVIAIVFFSIGSFFVTQALPWIRGLTNNETSSKIHLLSIYSGTPGDLVNAKGKTYEQVAFETFQRYGDLEDSGNQNYLSSDEFTSVWTLENKFDLSEDNFLQEESSLENLKKIFTKEGDALSEDEKELLNSFINEYFYRSYLKDKEVFPINNHQDFIKVKQRDLEGRTGGTSIYEYKISLEKIDSFTSSKESIFQAYEDKTRVSNSYREIITSPQSEESCELWKDDNLVISSLENSCEFYFGANSEILLESHDELIWESVKILDQKETFEKICLEDTSLDTLTWPLPGIRTVCTIKLNEDTILRVRHP